MATLHMTEWDRDAALTTARILLEIKAVNFRPDEPYTFTSGWKIAGLYRLPQDHLLPPRPYPRLRTRRREDRRHIGYETIEAVAGGETAGIPFAAWIADRLGAPMAYVRKQAKGFGRNALIEGDVPEGKRTLLVEDLTTDGQSKIRFAQSLRDAGAIFNHTFVVFYLRRLPRQLRAARRDGHRTAPSLHLVGRAGGVPRPAVFRRAARSPRCGDSSRTRSPGRRSMAASARPRRRQSAAASRRARRAYRTGGLRPRRELSSWTMRRLDRHCAAASPCLSASPVPPKPGGTLAQ